MKRSRPVVVAVAATFLLSCSSGVGDSPSTVAAPTFSPDPTYAFGDTLAVTLETATEGAAIHYTTDGSAPTSASATYTEPIALTATTTIRAFATRPGATDSAEVSATYTYRLVSLTLDEGSYNSGYALIGREWLALNRFTPDPGAFPFVLRSIAVWFVAIPAEGTPIELVVLADDDGDPANGAKLVLVHRAAAYFGNTWSVYALPEPVLLAGPGDVLVGVIVPEVLVGYGSAVSGRSWLGTWTTVQAPDPPSFPPDRSFAPAQFMGNSGNWRIRAWN